MIELALPLGATKPSTVSRSAAASGDNSTDCRRRTRLPSRGEETFWLLVLAEAVS
jgi:hypothetical protein